MTIKHIIEKGSACIEVFRELSHSFARTFGQSDRSRRSNEVNADDDIRALVESLNSGRVHVLTSGRTLLVPVITGKGANRTTTFKSSIIDAFDVGTRPLHQGKWPEFLQSTSWDPALGAASRQNNEESDGEKEEDGDVLQSGSVFDTRRENPLSIDEFADTDDGDDLTQRCDGLGGLGGGTE